MKELSASAGNTPYVEGWLIYASVLVDVPTRNIVQQHFDYIIPRALEPSIDVGSRVLVQFGNRRVQGFVLDISTESDIDDCREIIDIADEEPLLPYDLIDLARWLAREYMCPLAVCVRALMPAGLRIESDKRAELAVDFNTAVQMVTDTMGRRSSKALRIVEFLADGPVGVAALKNTIGVDTLGLLEALKTEGVVSIIDIWLPPRVKARTEARLFLGVSSEGDSFTKAQKRVMDAVVSASTTCPSDGISVRECLRLADCGQGVVDRLIAKGHIETRRIRVMRAPDEWQPQTKDELSHKPNMDLTSEQDAVLQPILEALDGCEPKVFVLAGVTGSGKTEVYLRAIQKVLCTGRSAIALVPEISLTPQTVSRFRSRFGSNVAVLHSRLSLGERLDEWVRIRKGDARVVVGARSAVFAPCDNLGIIIVDEEHESSYKQEDDPKYHAVEVAIQRCEGLGIPLVLGSATPSIESYYSARQDRYRLLKMTKRVDGSLPPPVTVVDMRDELKKGNKGILSRELSSCLEEVLQSGSQAIIMLNRRGYNTFVMCRECGYVVKCRDCEVSMTFHANPPILRCHYCNHSQGVPLFCPNCSSRYIRYFGTGTQRLEAELSQSFPVARVLRMDVDTTSGKNAHAKILGHFASGGADFLVGTQMIAKGLDFPNVTVVGVVSADVTLNLPDYRCAERTFQLLTQVSGRAGRGTKPGRVVVQTYNPTHYAVDFASKHDYDGFFLREVSVRQTLDMPPFSKLLQIVVSSIREEDAIRAANEIGLRLKADLVDEAYSSSSGIVGIAHIAGITGIIGIAGPAPAPLSRIEGRYRWQLVVRMQTCCESPGLSSLLNLYRREFGRGDVRLHITVKPSNLL